MITLANNFYFGSSQFTSAQTILSGPTDIRVQVGSTSLFNYSSQSLNINSSTSWDSATYATAANRAGLDFYIYAIIPSIGQTVKLILSHSASAPSGLDTTNSRLIGGFHCLCVAAGTLSAQAGDIIAHPLTGYAQGDILPQSIWDLNYRAVCGNNAGMVYDAGTQLWVDIYLPSGSLPSTIASAYNVAPLVSVDRNNFVQLGRVVGKRLSWDHEFQSYAEGSNQQTNIAGSAAPTKTGGNTDTNSRRCISNIGVEDCCGVLSQWLQDQSYQATISTGLLTCTIGAGGSGYAVNDVLTLAGGTGGQVTVTTVNAGVITGINITAAGSGYSIANGVATSGGTGTGATVNVTGLTNVETWGWQPVSNNRGQIFRQATYGDVKLTAGGHYSDGAYCGSRSRKMDKYRWYTAATLSARFVSEHLNILP